MKAAIALAMFVAIPAVAYAGEVHTLTVIPPHVSVGAAHPPTIGSATGGGGGGKVTIKELSIHKTTDQASPTLFKHAASGKHYSQPILH
ncbi:MAG TPA: type VI secretion system tube protein Hcp [Xanthobacteraceae bacterium]|nr:type VI secretion system tube protein Hcp [Xanthobacteraceae bacterium]